MKLDHPPREYDRMAAQHAAECVDHPKCLLRLAELDPIAHHQRMEERQVPGLPGSLPSGV